MSLQLFYDTCFEGRAFYVSKGRDTLDFTYSKVPVPKDYHGFSIKDLRYLPDVPENLKDFSEFLRLPFPKCLFEIKYGSGRGVMYVMATQDEDRIKLELFRSEIPEIYGFPFSYCQAAINKVGHTIIPVKCPILSYKYFKDYISLANTDMLKRAIEAKIIPDGNWDHYFIDMSETLGSVYSVEFELAAQVIISVLLLLGTKEKPRLVIPEIKRVLRRQKERKCPLVSYHELDLKKMHSQSGDSVSFSSSQKRFHWRRGHIRRLVDHLTWVRACHVGRKDLGEVVKEYKI